MRGRSPEERRDVRRRDESSRRFVAISHVRTVCVFGSRDASRFASEPDSRRVKIQLESARARHGADVDIRALEAPSGPRREPLAPRDAPGVFLPRHAHIPISTNMVVASVVAAPCAVLARLGARKSYGGRRGSPGTAPRASSPAAELVVSSDSDVRRGDAATPSATSFDRSPRAREALRAPRTGPRGGDPNSADRRTSSNCSLSVRCRRVRSKRVVVGRARPPPRTPLTLSNLRTPRHLSRRCHDARDRPSAPVPRTTSARVDAAKAGGWWTARPS